MALRQSLDGPSGSAPSRATTKNNDFRSHVPEFNGTTDGYKEYRKKVELFAARMRTKEAENTVGLDLMQGL